MRPNFRLPGIWLAAGKQPGTNQAPTTGLTGHPLQPGALFKPSVGSQEKAFKRVNRATRPIGPTFDRLASSNQYTVGLDPPQTGTSLPTKIMHEQEVC